jgi:hypothetical protein
MFISWYVNVPNSYGHRRERTAMNGEDRKDIALGAIALGVGVALGAVLANEKTRKTLVDKGKGWLSNIRQN